jgi:hypothetical protein
LAQRVDVDGYLKGSDPKMGELALKLRNLILELVPEADEVIKWKNLFYENNGAFCAILIHKSYLNLEFTRGRELKEIGYPLEGTGKNIRHLKIKKSADIGSESLKDLIMTAVELNDTR